VRRQGDARVDLLEFNSNAEIDPSDSPVVLLGCGHCFTGETLDGMAGMDDVYTRDKTGNFSGLQATPAQLAVSVPTCPDCKRPIRQFATSRYNCVVNRAVLDETSKRFLVKGRIELEALEREFEKIEEALEKGRSKDRGVSRGQLISQGIPASWTFRNALASFENPQVSSSTRSRDSSTR
jgi:hypothetical protein